MFISNYRRAHYLMRCIIGGNKSHGRAGIDPANTKHLTNAGVMLGQRALSQMFRVANKPNVPYHLCQTDSSGRCCRATRAVGQI